MELLFIEEMKKLPISEPLTRVNTDSLPLGFSQVWQSECGLVQFKTSANKVVSLSRWAIDEMVVFKKVSNLCESKFRHTAIDSKGFLILESRVQDLPSHHPLVTRWMFIQVSYNKESSRMDKVIVSIRGELLE
jgi:hypothetical protein